MNTFFTSLRHLALAILTTLGLCSGGAMAAQTAAVPDCHHDAAPVDVELYARDVLAGHIVTTSQVPVGTVLTMEYKTKDGKLHQITCRTTMQRTAALDVDGKIYDKKCGNRILAGFTVSTPPAVAASAPAVAASAVCTDDGCGNLTVINTVTHVTRRVELQTCHGSDARIPVEQKCPDVTLSPTNIVVPVAQVRCANCSQQQPAPQAQAKCEVSDGYRFCLGPPPQDCVCKVDADSSKKFQGVYFPGLQGGECKKAISLLARKHGFAVSMR